MLEYITKFSFFLLIFTEVSSKQRTNLIQLALQPNVISLDNYVFWVNATVPFYIHPDNFDHEQSIAILQALSMFSFRTCLKFKPVMAAPASNEHVLVFENPTGVRRCVFNTLGHSVFEPHLVVLGYDCLQSPQIDMAIMRALGLPFEHNRINRHIYIDILEENIEPSAMELFTMEATLPVELRGIPYDINSALHFGARDFSKNGHRTILFKDSNAHQVRTGLTKMDLRKIEIVYGPQCRARDRQEKFELCQSYPGVARKKRDTADVMTEKRNIDRKKRDLADNEMSLKRPEIDRKKRDTDAEELSTINPEIDSKTRDSEVVTKSLRVNPNITPPPNAIKDTLTELGIDDAVQNVVDEVHKVSALALENARNKYCNNTKPSLRTGDEKITENTDMLAIIEVVAHYVHGMVSNAVANLTKFCDESEPGDIYQRAGCGWNDNSDRCRQTYRSTKSGAVKYSTQHRPVYIQSTNHRQVGYGKKIYDPMLRASNDSGEITTETVSSRRKRDTVKDTEDVKGNEHVTSENQDKNYEQDNRDNEHKDEKEDNNEVKAENKGETKKEKENIKERAEKREEKAEKAEDDEKVVNADKAAMLRTGTTVPQHKVNRYEPLRRKSGRSRIRYATNEEMIQEMDISSLSIELKPRQKNHRESVDKKRKHRETEEETWTKRMKRKQRIQKERDESGEEDATESLMKKERKQRERYESDEQEVAKQRLKHKKDRKQREREDSTEEEDATESYKKPRKETDAPLPSLVKLSKANREFYNDRKWPGGVVYYLIQEDTTYDINDLRDRLTAVNDILKRRTCVKLKEISEDKAKGYEDYIVINNSPDYVTGRVGGRQTFGSIELFRGDQHRQHTAMMVMAMLGFYFEVSRHDRDKYVRVHARHVRPDKLHHFEKIREDATLPLPYDYSSATHPAWQFWRQIGKTGISTVATYKQKDPDGSVMKSLGQNTKLLSEIDIIKINSVYGNKCLHSDRTKLKENEDKSMQNFRHGGKKEVTAV